MLNRFLAPRQRYVLVIGDEGAVLAHVVGGTVRHHWAVAGTDDKELQRLSAALAERPGVPVIVLADLLEQSYRRETIPPVGMMDRPKILRRRLEMVFPTEDIKGALNLGERVGQRGDFAYLFVALPSSSDLDRWIAFLGAVPNPVANMSLLPVESAGMVEALARADAGEDVEPAQWVVFLNRQQNGGLRQIVIERSRLALTRLIPPLTDPAALAGTIEQELSTTRGYLGRLGYREEEGLDLIVIGDGAVRETLDPERLGVRRLSVLAPVQVGDLLGIGGVDAAGEHGELLHAAWAAGKRKPALELASAALGRRQLEVATRRWAVVGLAATAAAIVAYTGNVALDLWSFSAEVAKARGEVQRLQSRLDATKREISQFRVEASTIVATLEIHAGLVAESIDPLPTLLRIRDSLGPRVRLTKLAWGSSEAPPAAGRRATSTTGQPGEGPSYVVDCVMTVDLGGVADAERAVNEVWALEARLQERFAEHQVEVVRQALDILPTQTFSGSSGGETSPGSRGEWTAEITIRGPAP